MTVSFIGLKYFKGFVCKPVEDFKKACEWFTGGEPGV